MKTIKKIFGVAACIGILAASATPVVAQIYTLGDLVANNGTLTIGDKVFSGFGWIATGADASELNAEAAGLSVSASIVSGTYYLDFTGSIAVNNLAGANSLGGNLKLSYTVAATAGLIWMIDQNYTPNALPVAGNQITITETVQNNAGTTVGNSTLTLTPPDFSDPPPEAGDNLNINPAQQQLFVVKLIAITAAAGQLVGLSDVEQSFHQVPEPSAMLLGSLGGGLLLFLRSRRPARRN